MEEKPNQLDGYCYCRCGNETPIAKITDRKHGRVKGEHLRYCPGHHIGSQYTGRTHKPRAQVPTKEGVQAALKKKQNYWRNKPDGSGEFPEYVEPNTCGKHNPPAVWLGNVRCPRCSKVEKTPLVHNEYEEAENWDDPYSERGWEIKKAYKEEDKVN